MSSRAERRLRQVCTQARWRARFARLGIGTILGKPLLLAGGRHIRIGDRVRVGPLWRLEALECFQGRTYRPSISIGDRVTAEAGLHIAAAQDVRIGDDVLIASWVYITDHGHRIDSSLPPIAAGLDDPEPVTIGAGCWLGERVVILPGVTLGPGCVVGAGAVVTRSFPAGSVVAGVPAQVLRTRELVAV